MSNPIPSDPEVTIVNSNAGHFLFGFITPAVNRDGVYKIFFRQAAAAGANLPCTKQNLPNDAVVWGSDVTSPGAPPEFALASGETIVPTLFSIDSTLLEAFPTAYQQTSTDDTGVFDEGTVATKFTFCAEIQYYDDNFPTIHAFETQAKIDLYLDMNEGFEVTVAAQDTTAEALLSQQSDLAVSAFQCDAGGNPVSSQINLGTPLDVCVKSETPGSYLTDAVALQIDNDDLGITYAPDFSHELITDPADVSGTPLLKMHADFVLGGLYPKKEDGEHTLTVTGEVRLAIGEYSPPGPSCPCFTLADVQADFPNGPGDLVASGECGAGIRTVLGAIGVSTAGLRTRAYCAGCVSCCTGATAYQNMCSRASDPLVGYDSNILPDGYLSYEVGITTEEMEACGDIITTFCNSRRLLNEEAPKALPIVHRLLASDPSSDVPYATQIVAMDTSGLSVGTVAGISVGCAVVIGLVSLFVYRAVKKPVHPQNENNKAGVCPHNPRSHVPHPRDHGRKQGVISRM